MRKIFVIAGHGAGDSGAVGNGRKEADMTRMIARRLKELGGDNVELGDLNRNYYSDNGISKLSISKDFAIVEIHMDSAAASARGAHVIIDSTLNADEYDNALADNLSAILPGRANKIVKRSDLANPKRATAKGYNYRLVEVGFISNSEDVKIVTERLDEVCEAILKSFGIPVVGNSSPAPAPEPEPQPTPQPEPEPQPSKNFGGVYRCNVNGLRVRTAPSLSASVVATYNRGATVTLDDWYTIKDGWVWGRYTGAQSGQKRYVAVGKPTGGPAADDYLTKI